MKNYMKMYADALENIRRFENGEPLLHEENRINLHHYEKQLIKYAKNHFEQNYCDFDNPFPDLKYFASKLYGIEYDQVEDRNVIYMVTKLYQKLTDYGYLTFDLSNFLDRLFKNAWWNDNRKNINQIDIVRLMLSEFQNMRINHLNDLPDLELGENDEKIFSKEV